MAFTGQQYPTLVDPRYQDYAEAVDRAIQEERIRRTPRVTEILQPPPENSILTDIGHGLARGAMVEAPQMFGQALQAFGADETGRDIEEAAKARGKDELYRTTGLAGDVAAMLPTVAGIGALALTPGGQPLAAGAGAALFGGSQYTMTREKGGSVGQALTTGGIQGVGQAIGGAVAGRLISGGANALQKGALARGFDAYANPSVLGPLARGLVHAEAVQIPTQAAAAAGVAGVESGLPDTPSAWEAAKHSFAPTALLTAALTPFGLPSIMKTNRARTEQTAILQNPQQTPFERAMAARAIAADLRTIDREGADRWQLEALAAINSGVTPELRPDYKFEATPPEPPPPSTSLQSGFPPGVQPAPPTPMQERINALTGVSRDAHQPYDNRFDADLVWKHAFEAREQQDRSTAQGEETYQKLAKQLITNTPTGVLSFPEWYKAQREKGGPLAEGGAPAKKQSALQDAFLSYVHRELRQREDIRNAEQPLDQEGQANLFPDRPPGVHVEEHGPLEHIDVKAPEEGPPTYPVEEAPTAGHVDVKVPEEYDTINRQGRATWLREQLGGRVPIERLAAAPSGTLPLEVQKLWHEKGGDAQGPAYKERLEQFFTSLTGRNIRDALTLEESANATKAAAETDTGTKSQSATDTTGTKVATDVDQGVGAAGNAEPGVGAGQVPSEAQVENITLRGIPEPTNVHDPLARTPEGQVGYGETSRRPPTQEEIDAALRPAAPPTYEVGEGPTTTNIKPAYEVQRARQEMERETHGAPETEAQRVAHDASIAEARQREEEARAQFTEATPELQQVRQRLAEIQQQTEELGQLRERYNEIARLKPSELTAMQAAARPALQAEIGRRAAEQRAIAASGEVEHLNSRLALLTDTATLTPEHGALSDAVGRTERAEQRGRADPATDPVYYQFTHGLDPNTGVARGVNLARVFNYLEAHQYAGTLKVVGKEIVGLFPEEARATAQRIFNIMTGRAGARVEQPTAARRAAKEALGLLSPAEHTQFVKYATQIIKAIETNARVNEPGRAAQEKYAEALRKWTKMHADFDYKNAKIEEATKAGRMTRAEAESLRASLERGRDTAAFEFKTGGTIDDLVTALYARTYDGYERDLAAADREKQGLAAISNERLGARVAETPHAMGVLEHLGLTHHSSVIRAVAKLLAAAKPTATIEVVANPDFNGGRYNPARDVIEIGRGGMNTTTMLHEITHAVAHAGIIRALANVGRTDLKAQEQKEVEAIKSIQGIMERFRNIADPENPEHMHALIDEHEFVSEALNNPDIQQLLDGRGWLQKMFDNIREFVTGWKRAPTDFDELMRAAPTLFGNPNRDLSLIFRSPLNYNVRDPFTAAVSMFRQLSGFDWINRKGQEKNLSSEGYAQFLKFSSLMQQRRMFGSMVASAKEKFPQFAGPLDKIHTIYDKLRDHVSDRGGITNLIQVEGGEIADRAGQLRTKYRKHFDDMGSMGTEATRLRIDASAKSFADAQRRNPELTIEEWNSPASQLLRNEYKRLEGISTQIRARDGKDAPTPVSIYHEMVGYHDLLFTRHTAENMMLMLRTYGAHEVSEIKGITPQLDTKVQAGAGPGSVPMHQQQLSLERGMKQAMAEVKKIYDRELAAGGARGKGTLDAESLLRIMEESHANFMRQRAVPYMHIGRPGDKMIMFTVTGGDAEWNEVAKLMNATREKGGLERGMGPAYKGNRRVYMHFDNDAMYSEAYEKLRPFLERKLLSEWADGPISEHLRSQDAATPGFIKALRDRINGSEQFDAATKKELTSQLFDTYLQQLPDNSPLKASATRDGFNGYSTDYLRSFADRVTMSSQSLSRIRSASRIAETLKELNANMRELREIPGMTETKSKIGLYMSDIRGRMDELNRPVNSPYIDRIRAFPALWRLALSPAYMVTVAYQPWQSTMPLLGARFGYATSMRTMGRNWALSLAIITKALEMGLGQPGADNFTKLANLSNMRLEFSKMMKGDGVTPLFTSHQLDLLSHVQWQNVLNFGQMNQLARLSAGDKTPSAKLISLLTTFPHYIEVSNRIITALSAHELTMQEATAKGVTGTALDAVHEKAKAYAVQLIRESDGDHSQANIARNLGRHGLVGKYTPLSVGFAHFYIQMGEMLAHKLITSFVGPKGERAEAAKGFAGISGMTALISGTLGIPFMSLFTAIANRVISLFQDDNDTPPDVQTAVRQLTGKLVGAKGIYGGGLGGTFGGGGAQGGWGDKAEEVISRGLPRLLDIDMSQRAGLQELVPFTQFLNDRRKLEDALKDHAFDAFGPAFGAAAGIWTGWQDGYKQGDWPKFINDAFPAAVRGWAKAYRQSKYGYETEGGGNTIPIAAPSAWNLLAQGAGFTSSERAEQSEVAFAYKTNQQLLERRHAAIRNQMYRAAERGAYDDLAQLMDQEMKFIMQHPQFHMNLQQGLKQRAEARAVGEATGTGILANKRALYPMMQQFSPQGFQ
jgi:hypothetical protein